MAQWNKKTWSLEKTINFESLKTIDMKNILSATYGSMLALITLFMFSGCSKIGTITLNKTYSDIEFTIPSPQAAGLVEFESQVNADLQQLASDNGFDINKIESATLNSITMTIVDTNATPVTYDIVDAASCSLFADGQSVLEVGTDDATQTSPTTMDFDLKGVDVSNYLKASTFKVQMKLTTNAPITHDVPMKATLRFSFKVKPLK